MIATFNIMNSSGRALNVVPILWDIENVSEFCLGIRENALDICHFGADSYSTIKEMFISVYFYEDLNDEEFNENSFNIRIKNIREFKKYIKMSYDDIKVEYNIEKRNNKISELGL